MGCSASNYSNSNKTMVFAQNARKVGNSPPKGVNIRLPLTEREVFAITRSWKKISQNMTNTGITMFLK